ncbi:MAG: YceI family protein [Verrucomicrobiota bacterium]
MMAISAISVAVVQAAEIYEIDQSHSTVSFEIRHLGISKVSGRFTDYEGAISFDEKAPEKSTVEFTIKATSIDTDNTDRDEHLRNEDFFNIEKYPDITFKKTALKKTAENTWEVTGDLKLLDVTKPITVEMETFGPIKGSQGETRRGAETTFKIKRSDYGMKYGIGPVGDQVKITLAISAIKK